MCLCVREFAARALANVATDIENKHLLLRSGGEGMVLLEQNPSSLYPSLNALSGQEFAPDVMIAALEQAVTERCRVFWVFWQC